ncbi:hypothetical protein BgiBS90_033579 [Biomphalaria glabrata]|nr:hypothetical protein BgiBS90_033579 [Biomphalaria glabrata]
MNKSLVISLLTGLLVVHSIEATQKGGNKDVPPTWYNYNIQLHRVASFRPWPSLYHVSPVLLANLGYFYIDDGSGVIDDESVMCHACYTTLPGLSTVDNISQVQWTHSSDCPYSHDLRLAIDSRPIQQREARATVIRQETDSVQNMTIQNAPLILSNIPVNTLPTSFLNRQDDDLIPQASGHRDTTPTFDNQAQVSSPRRQHLHLDLQVRVAQIGCTLPIRTKSSSSYSPTKVDEI